MVGLLYIIRILIKCMCLLPSFKWSSTVYFLGIVQWDLTRRDHPGNTGRVSGSSPVISLVCSNSVATSLLLLRPDSLLLHGLMVATSFVVTTLFSQYFSRVDVATTVSCRDIVVFLFFWLLSCESRFRLRPLFCL